MATVTISGDTFEAGASILHPKNYHALNYTQYLNLKRREPSSSSSFGIWDGKGFLIKTAKARWKVPILEKLISMVNSVCLFVRYGFSLLKMEAFVESTVDKFLKYYDDVESRPVFESVEEMLKWSGLYNLTQTTLEDVLSLANFSPTLMQELATVSFSIFFFNSILVVHLIVHEMVVMRM